MIPRRSGLEPIGLRVLRVFDWGSRFGVEGLGFRI